MNRDEFIGGIVIFLFGGATALLSLRMSIGTFRSAGSGLFPFCLGILLMILSGIFLLNLAYQKRKVTEKKESIFEISRSTKQMLLFLGVMALATLFFNRLGYPLTSFILMVTLLRILGMKRWAFNILLSFVTAAASYLLFVQWLKIPLPKGWQGLMNTRLQAGGDGIITLRWCFLLCYFYFASNENLLPRLQCSP